MGRDDFCAELNDCVGAYSDGMGAGEDGIFVDEGLLGAGDGRGKMAAGAGCGHLDFGAAQYIRFVCTGSLNTYIQHTSNGWICSEPPNFRQRVLTNLS